MDGQTDVRAAKDCLLDRSPSELQTQTKPQTEDLGNLLLDLFNLLEAHAPTWYSYEFHVRLSAALITLDMQSANRNDR